MADFLWIGSFGTDFEKAKKTVKKLRSSAQQISLAKFQVFLIHILFWEHRPTVLLLGVNNLSGCLPLSSCHNVSGLWHIPKYKM
jgi:hypothetical protein